MVSLDTSLQYLSIACNCLLHYIRDFLIECTTLQGGRALLGLKLCCAWLDERLFWVFLIAYKILIFNKSVYFCQSYLSICELSYLVAFKDI